MKLFTFPAKLARLAILLTFVQCFSFGLFAQQQPAEIVLRVNYLYLDLDLIDDPSFNEFSFRDILNKEGQIQLKALETGYANLGDHQLSKIFGFMSWKDSVSTSRQGQKVTIPPFWATFTLKVPASADYFKLMDFLNQSIPLIDYAEPSFKAELLSPPDDTLYHRQRSMMGTSAMPHAGINIEEAWEMETGEPFIKVGVLDTGIDSLHPDLEVLYGGSYFRTPGTFYGYGIDTYNHGTSSAGVIAAKRNNDKGIAGIAGGNNGTEKGVSLIDLKYDFLGNPGNQYIMAAVVDAARSVGTYWNYADYVNQYNADGSAYDNTDYFRKTPGFGVHIGNHSYALVIQLPLPNIEVKGPLVSSIYTDCLLCREAYLFSLKNGVINVVARGNNSHLLASNQLPTNIDDLYPQNFPDNWVISVGASGHDGTTVREGINQSPYEASQGFFSLYGGKMDLIAPGSDSIVYSTSSTFSGGVPYNRYNGTSAAAPHVSGVVGLLLSHYNQDCYAPSNLSIEDVEYILEKSATDVLDPGFDVVSGAGRLNAGAALKMIDYPKKQIVHPDSLVSSVEVARDTIALKYNTAFNGEGWGPISRSLGLTRQRDYKVVRVAYENTYSFAEYILPFTQIVDYWARASVSNSLKLYSDTSTVPSSPGFPQFDRFDMTPFVEITDFNMVTKTIKLKGYYYHFIEKFIPGTFISDGIPIDLWHSVNPANGDAKMGFSIYLQDSTLTSRYDFPCDSANVLYDSTYVPYENTTGIEEHVKNMMEVFPNPVTEILQIRFTDHAVVEKEIVLRDLQGKKINSWSTSNQEFSIPMSNLTQGIYILSCSISGYAQVFKIIKL